MLLFSVLPGDDKDPELEIKFCNTWAIDGTQGNSCSAVESQKSPRHRAVLWVGKQGQEKATYIFTFATRYRNLKFCLNFCFTVYVEIFKVRDEELRSRT